MSKTKSKKRRTQPSRKQQNSHAAAAVQQERGGLLTAVIIVIILHGILFTGLAYYDLSNNGLVVRSLYLPLLFISSIADVIAGVALWNWKRWGFQLYVAAALIMATSALMNTGSIMVLFASVLPPIVVAYVYLPKQHLFDS
ncbi:MAG: hypothetical protein GY796_15075 [Chloroflexi bacterium]|nr:hypothetical protein [Chloroflexota bacterium]